MNGCKCVDISLQNKNDYTSIFISSKYPKIINKENLIIDANYLKLPTVLNDTNYII